MDAAMEQEAEVGEVDVLLAVAEVKKLLHLLQREHRQEIQPARRRRLPRERRRLRPKAMFQNDLAVHDEEALLSRWSTQTRS